MNRRAPWPSNSWASRVTNWIGEEWVCEPEGDQASKLVGVTGDKLDQGGVGVCDLASKLVGVTDGKLDRKGVGV